MTNNVFFSKQTTSAVDGVRPDGLGRYSGKTQAELEEEYGPLVIMDSDEAYDLHCAAHIKPPKEIDDKRFWYLLEVLPPCQWVRHNGAESFHLSELYTGHIGTIVVRIGTRYYEMQDSVRMTHEERVAKCMPLHRATEELEK